MKPPSGRAARWAIAAGILAVVTAVPVVLMRNDGHEEPSASSPSAVRTSSAQISPPASAAGPSATPATSATSPRSTTRPSPTRPAPTRPAPTTAAPRLPTDLRGRDLTVLPTSRHVVALTFDAGGDAAGLPSILATLAAQHVQATFFLTGRWTAANPTGVAAIVAGRHRIGDHSITHPHFTALSDRQIDAEVLGAQATITKAGADPRPFFRFPFGDRNARTIADVNALGYLAISWTVDTLGWEGTAGGMSAQRVADRAVAGLRPGEIVLMHVGANPDDGTTFDADALPSTIQRMRAAGFSFVTLGALLGT